MFGLILVIVGIALFVMARKERQGAKETFFDLLAFILIPIGCVLVIIALT